MHKCIYKQIYKFNGQSFPYESSSIFHTAYKEIGNTYFFDLFDTTNDAHILNVARFDIQFCDTENNASRMY